MKGSPFRGSPNQELMRAMQQQEQELKQIGDGGYAMVAVLVVLVLH